MMTTAGCELRQVFILLLSLLSFMEAYVIQIVEYEPKAISCWNCPDKDDATCERSKMDHLCPLNLTMCRILHHVDMVTGQSIVINRSCAHESECTADKVGCQHTHISRMKECVSCCNNANCKDNISRNASAAWMYSTLKKSCGTSLLPSVLPAILVPSLLMMTILYQHELHESCY